MGASRRFNTSERSTLFLLSGGQCQLCGRDLVSGWHADHVLPWSLSGETDVINGQALCPTCNLRKGAYMGSILRWPDAIALRAWQARAFKKFLQHDGDNFLVVATPGAGKTKFALRVAHEMLTTGMAVRLVVVTPTDHLKRQWAEAAAEVGIHLDPDWSNGDGREASDYHGVAVTYAQVGTNPDIHRVNCRNRLTVVILDEIHHAGDGNRWGDALRAAFGSAVKRLLLSGTPFRSDNNTIPFVAYEDGQSHPDFSYSYADALADEVCRAILFPSYEGKMEWISGGKEFRATFADGLNEKLAAERLRTALDPDGEWLSRVIRDADEKLSSIRDTHPAAGGLIIAADQRHAKRIAELVSSVSREVPTLAISDESAASHRIKEFARGHSRWIIAVKMVSEGVDIPRLRVGVYATNVLTEMFFRQAVGRFVRMMVGIDEQNSYLYIPKIEPLIGFVQTIKEERDHQLQEQIEEDVRDDGEGEGGGEGEKSQVGLFMPVASTGQADDVFYDQDRMTQEEIGEAVRIARQSGVPAAYDPAILARFLRNAKGQSPILEPPADAPPAVTTPVPLAEKKAKLRGIIKRLVGLIVVATDGDIHYRDVHRRLYEIDGSYQDQATLEQLESRVKYLDSWLREVRNGG